MSREWSARATSRTYRFQLSQPWKRYKIWSSSDTSLSPTTFIVFTTRLLQMRVTLPVYHSLLLLDSHSSQDDHKQGSPATSEYSLPCLSSDDGPEFGLEVRTWCSANEYNTDFVREGLLLEAEPNVVLPPSDAATPSRVTPPTSPEHARAIRPFPLLDMMLSPSFAAIKSMDDDSGMFLDCSFVSVRLSALL